MVELSQAYLQRVIVTAFNSWYNFIQKYFEIRSSHDYERSSTHMPKPENTHLHDIIRNRRLLNGFWTCVNQKPARHVNVGCQKAFADREVIHGEEL